MAWTPRLYAPDVSIKYYRHTGYLVGGVDGVNECMIIDPNDGDVMPNCVGYTWGRWYEAFGTRPRLSTGNAGDWYAYNDGYRRSPATPALGAIACFSSDSYGHVCVVEQIIDATHVNTSNSAIGGPRFWQEILEYANGTWNRTRAFGYTFQGFILPPGGGQKKYWLWLASQRRFSNGRSRIINNRRF